MMRVTLSTFIAITILLHTSVMPIVFAGEEWRLGGGEWPMWGGDETRSGRSPSTLTPPLSIRWKNVPGDRWVDYYIGSSPAVSGSMVFVGSTEGVIRALDVVDGVERWRFVTDDAIYSSPTVYSGRVYFGSDDGKLYAVEEASGDLIWSFETGGRVRSSPLIHGGIVYFGSSDGNIYAVDAETGGLKWEYPTKDEVISSPSIFDGKIYIGSDDGNLYSLDASDGALIWKYFIGNRIWSYVSVVDGTAYVGSYTNRLYAIDAQRGVLRWTVETGYYIRSSAAVSQGLAIIGSTDGSFRAMNVSDGSVIWRFQTEAGLVTNAPIISGDVVYVTSPDRSVYALNLHRGTLLWRHNVSAPISSTAAISRGTLYVQSTDNALYAFSPTATDISIIELYPSGPAQYIKIYNPTDGDRDLTGLILSTGEESYTIPEGTVLKPGEAIILAKDDDAFSSSFGSEPDLIWSDRMTLKESGGEVNLIDESGVIVDASTYGPDLPDAAPLNEGDALLRRMSEDGRYIKTSISKLDFYSASPTAGRIAAEPPWSIALYIAATALIIAIAVLLSRSWVKRQGAVKA